MSVIFPFYIYFQNFKLIFGLFSNRWQGHIASIEESPDNTVWGIVYELSNSDLANLDK